ncbi:hypothetical protein [Hymenobacter busanensis]|nr:hypothetical protein [Hymenobacter busanensis]QHJ06370.1 hypothetical protein GUY19_03275 [Hymenobacter busanensis]
MKQRLLSLWRYLRRFFRRVYHLSMVVCAVVLVLAGLVAFAQSAALLPL